MLRTLLAFVLLGGWAWGQGLKDAPCIPQAVADYMHVYHPTDQLKPVCKAQVPVDVPAIRKREATSAVITTYASTASTWAAGLPNCSGVWETKSGIAYCMETRWTCRDKHRVLLTAENGDHWCHKVSTGQP